MISWLTTIQAWWYAIDEIVLTWLNIQDDVAHEVAEPIMSNWFSEFHKQAFFNIDQMF